MSTIKFQRQGSLNSEVQLFHNLLNGEGNEERHAQTNKKVAEKQVMSMILDMYMDTTLPTLGKRSKSAKNKQK